MKKKFKLSLFIFRRDIRLYDNTALNEALSSSEVVIPCFIFDDRQMHNNLYFGENAFLFLLQSLAELSEALEKQDGVLYFLKGIAETCVEMLLTTLPIEAVFLNRDYTPFSKRRDGALKKIAKENKVCFLIYQMPCCVNQKWFIRKMVYPILCLRLFSIKQQLYL